MQELNGNWMVIAGAAVILFILAIAIWLHLSMKKRRQQVYLSLQTERQNKNFNFPDAWNDGVGEVRVIRTEEVDTSIFDEEVFTAYAKTPVAKWPNVVSLYIKAKPHECFYGYDLMQSILNHGLIHGSMNFFHYSESGRTLFSLASSEPPGSFDLNNMGGFKTASLCLFMQPNRFQTPIVIFEQMVNMAHQVAEDLGGDLEDEHHHLLTPERLNYWKSQLTEKDLQIQE